MPVAAVGVVVVVFVSSKRDAETPLAHSPSAPFCLARAKRAPDLHPLALPLPFWLSLARVMPAHIAAMSPTDHAQDPSRPHVRPPPPAACSPKPTEDGRATWAAVGCCAPPSSPGLLPRPALPPSAAAPGATGVRILLASHRACLPHVRWPAANRFAAASGSLMYSSSSRLDCRPAERERGSTLRRALAASGASSATAELQRMIR